MQLMLSIYSAERYVKKMYADYTAGSAEIPDTGIVADVAELQPIDTATTIRARIGKALATDGPFAATKEALNSYYLINVRNLDETRKWVAKILSALDGSIEVGPLELP